MPNMGYIRFQNTLRDYADCWEALDNDGVEDLSKAEKAALRSLIDLSRDLVAWADEWAWKLDD